MSRIAFTGNPLGTGTVTIASPNTNSDRTVTLPDTTGTLYISGGDIGTPSAGNGSNLTDLSASNLASGTVPDARFPATLPATSGANLTNLNASNLSTGTVGTARLGSGTANNTTFLRGDGSWQTVSSTPTTAQVLSATAGASFNAVGSYVFGAMFSTSAGLSSGGNYSAGASNGQILSATVNGGGSNNLSGTWKNMGGNYNIGGSCGELFKSVFLRVA